MAVAVTPFHPTNADANMGVNAQPGNDVDEENAALSAAQAQQAQRQAIHAPAEPVDALPSATVGGITAANLAQHVSGTFGLGSSVPDLPMQTIAKKDQPTGQELRSVAANLNLNDTEAYRIIREMAQKQYDLDATLTRSANKAVIDGKLQQAADLHAQIAGEQKSAVTSLVSSIAATGVSATMGIAGTKMRSAPGKDDAVTELQRELQKPNASTEATKKDFVDGFLAQINQKKSVSAEKDKDVVAGNTPSQRAPEPQHKFHTDFDRFQAWRIQSSNSGRNRRSSIEEQYEQYVKTLPQGKSIKHDLFSTADGRGALGAGLDVAAQSAGQVISQMGTVIDKLGGGQHEADQAKLAQKQDEVQISIGQQVLDSAKAMRDRNLKQVSDSLDTLKDVAARYAAVIDKLS